MRTLIKPSQVHKYPLRSQSRSSTITLSNTSLNTHSSGSSLHQYPHQASASSSSHLKKSCPLERGKRELVALGASSSSTTSTPNQPFIPASHHQRDFSEPPSRLTRSGAVLRRSTRSSRGKCSSLGKYTFYLLQKIGTVILIQPSLVHFFELLNLSVFF